VYMLISQFFHDFVIGDVYEEGGIYSTLDKVKRLMENTINFAYTSKIFGFQFFCNIFCFHQHKEVAIAEGGDGYYFFAYNIQRAVNSQAGKF